MVFPRSSARARLRSPTFALFLVTLLALPVLIAPVNAERVEEPDRERVIGAFDELRTEIGRTEGLPEGPKAAFLAEADAAQIALLLRAVQAAREAARNEAAAVQILTALQQHNRALSDTLGYDGDAIDRQAETIKRYVLTNDWPK